VSKVADLNHWKSSDKEKWNRAAASFNIRDVAFFLQKNHTVEKIQ
jgi:hypothetical protein